MGPVVAESEDFVAWEQDLRRSTLRRLARAVRTISYEAVMAYGAAWVPHAMSCEVTAARQRR